MFLPDPYLAIKLSLIVGGWCVLVGAPIAILLGWLLARGSFRFKPVVSSVLLVPLVLPPVVTGLLLLDLFGRSSPVGRALAALGVRVPFTLAGAVVAALVMGLPLFVLSARSAFEAVDPRFDELARSLGMRPWRAFFKVTLPLALPGIGAGALLAFARALGEFGATAVLSGNLEGRTRTIAMAVYTLLDASHGGREVRVLVVSSLLISLVALAGFEALVRWQHRRLEFARDAG